MSCKNAAVAATHKIDSGGEDSRRSRVPAESTCKWFVGDDVCDDVSLSLSVSMC